MPEAIAGIALPEGRPGAAEEVAQTLDAAAAGFERTAETVERALAMVPSWEGLAAIAYQDHTIGYKEAANRAAQAMRNCGADARRYGHLYDEAHARIERLQRAAEECLARIKVAERGAAEAARREQAARDRATDAMLRSPLDGGFSLAEQADAVRAADAAADDRRRYEAEAEAEREELERLQKEALEEHERIRQAGRQGAAALQAAVADMPRVQPPGGPAAGGAPAEDVGWWNGDAFAAAFSPFHPSLDEFGTSKWFADKFLGLGLAFTGAAVGGRAQALSVAARSVWARILLEQSKPYNYGPVAGGLRGSAQRWSRVGRRLPVVGAAVGVGSAAVSQWHADAARPDLTRTDRVGRAAGVGAYLGGAAAAGGAAGAFVGTFIPVPIAGTVVGAAVGALGGLAVGAVAAGFEPGKQLAADIGQGVANGVADFGEGVADVARRMPDLNPLR